jgi:UDP-N-acetylglucosamine acyltransferase
VTSSETELAPRIHPSAIVDPDARIAESATVGPYSIIGPGVEIGERVRIASHVLVARDTRLAEDCVVHHGAVLGTDPQDLKYDGEATRLEVGPRTTIREYCTLNRGTGREGVTRVEADCLLMAYVHVAHDCLVGEHAILANTVQLAGHVEIGPFVTIGGVTGVHQFVRIGAHAFIGACSKPTQDVPPFLLADGHPCTARGLNLIGLKRRGFSDDVLRRLRRAYRAVYKSSRNIGDAIDEIAAWEETGPEVDLFVNFVRDSERGIIS